MGLGQTGENQNYSIQCVMNSYLVYIVGLGQAIWKKLIEIQQQTLYLTQLVNRQLKTSAPDKGSYSLPDDVHLPLNSVQGLRELEEKLKTTAVRKALVCSLMM